MFKIKNYLEKITKIETNIKKIFSDLNINYNFIKDEENTIRLVFAGQYSAGKSSILKMLTGKEDIEIGAKITTQQATKYEWNGISIIDTPGIHTELRKDHDEISYNSIANADMLVFVITNELFDSYLAEHFRKLAIERDKAGEMILVVNKMQRSSKGNTKEQQAVIEEDLKKVFEPYTPEQLNLCFLDAESYLDSLKERKNDPELANFLFTVSGYNEFIEKLNCFVKEKTLTSKLTTKLYQLEEQLYSTLQKIETKSNDADINALEENFRQQRHVLFKSKYRLQQEIKNVFLEYSDKIRGYGLEAANLIFEGCKIEEVETELEDYIKKVENLCDECQNIVSKKLEKGFFEIHKDIENIENSNFSHNLKINLEGKFEGLPENIKQILNNVGIGSKDIGNHIVANAFKTGSNGGLKLTNFSGGNVHDVVLKIGHNLGHKFRPWEAIKLAKGVAIGAQALSVLGVGLSIFMQIKSDIDEEKIRKDLRKNRQNIRSQFNSTANDLDNFSKIYIKENVEKTLDAFIEEIDSNIYKIRETVKNHDASCLEIEHLLGECNNLIKEIHNM